MNRSIEIVRRLRLYSGLVLMAYLTTHLFNIALGILSLEAMDAALKIFQLIWSPGGPGVIVPAAAIVHLLVVFWELQSRPNLKMHGGEIARLVFGLLIPYAIVAHYVGSHLSPLLLGYTPDFPSAIYSFWNPSLLSIMTGLVLISWLHGCMGIHFWLRFKPWYHIFSRIALVPAIALPVLALAGFVAAGKEVMERIEDPLVKREYLIHQGARTAEEMESDTMKIGNIAGQSYTGLLALLFGAIALSRWYRARSRSIRVLYPDGREVLIHPGASLLDASRLGGIPHASVCGGRGRCSTCRIRVSSGGEHLSEPAADELKVLARVGVDENVRLACCCVPGGPVQIHPLMHAPTTGVKDSFGQKETAAGRDMDIAILFADLRGFTSVSEHKLPYDVVFLLNQYFQLMGQAIEAENGHVDKFIGDGIMALFGLDTDLRSGCRSALRAARRMESQLGELNERLAQDLPEPLNMGIGIHCGHVIVGQMGYAQATGLTAIGDPVNTASRLESATREYKCRLIISEDVAREAGIEPDARQAHEMAVRGRTRPLRIFSVETVAALPPH